MKREIKFRVWTGNEMEYNITVGKFGIFYVNPENGDGLNPLDTASLTTCTTKYPDDIPLMQFAERYDKNNKEIFQGDIVMDVYNQKYVVCYDDGETPTFWLDGKQEECEIEHYKLWRSSDDRLCVIGNIYENPLK